MKVHMRALYLGWETLVKCARVMTVPAVEMQEEKVLRNLLNTISNHLCGMAGYGAWGLVVGLGI